MNTFQKVLRALLLSLLVVALLVTCSTPRTQSTSLPERTTTVTVTSTERPKEEKPTNPYQSGATVGKKLQELWSATKDFSRGVRDEFTEPRSAS